MQVASSPTQNERVHWQVASCKPLVRMGSCSSSVHQMSCAAGHAPQPLCHALKQKGRSPAKFNGKALAALNGTTRLISNYETSHRPVRFPPVERKKDLHFWDEIFPLYSKEVIVLLFSVKLQVLVTSGNDSHRLLMFRDTRTLT